MGLVSKANMTSLSLHTVIVVLSAIPVQVLKAEKTYN